MLGHLQRQAQVLRRNVSQAVRQDPLIRLLLAPFDRLLNLLALFQHAFTPSLLSSHTLLQHGSRLLVVLFLLFRLLLLLALPFTRKQRKFEAKRLPLDRRHLSTRKQRHLSARRLPLDRRQLLPLPFKGQLHMAGRRRELLLQHHPPHRCQLMGPHIVAGDWAARCPRSRVMSMRGNDVVGAAFARPHLASDN